MPIRKIWTKVLTRINSNLEMKVSNTIRESTLLKWTTIQMHWKMILGAKTVKKHNQQWVVTKKKNMPTNSETQWMRMKTIWTTSTTTLIESTGCLLESAMYFNKLLVSLA